MQAFYPLQKNCLLVSIFMFFLISSIFFLNSPPVLAASQNEINYWRLRQQMKDLNHKYRLISAEHTRYTKAFYQAIKYSNAAERRGDRQNAVYYNGVAQQFSSHMAKLRAQMDNLEKQYYQVQNDADWLYKRFGPFGGASGSSSSGRGSVSSGWNRPKP